MSDQNDINEMTDEEVKAYVTERLESSILNVLEDRTANFDGLISLDEFMKRVEDDLKRTQPDNQRQG